MSSIFLKIFVTRNPIKNFSNKYIEWLIWENRDYYINPLTKRVYWSHTWNWFELWFSELKGNDYKTLTILWPDISFDKNHIYFEDKIVFNLEENTQVISPENDKEFEDFSVKIGDTPYCLDTSDYLHPLLKKCNKKN